MAGLIWPKSNLLLTETKEAGDEIWEDDIGSRKYPPRRPVNIQLFLNVFS